MTQKQHQLPSPSFFFPSFNPDFWKGGQKKKKVLGEDLKSSCHRYLLAGHTMFLVKKRLWKTKYDFEGSVSQFLVQFCDMLVQLNYSNYATRNQDVFVGSSEISTIVIVKHV